MLNFVQQFPAIFYTLHLYITNYIKKKPLEHAILYVYIDLCDYSIKWIQPFPFKLHLHTEDWLPSKLRVIIDKV